MSKKPQYDTRVGYFDGTTFHPHKTLFFNGVDITCPAKLDFSSNKIQHAMRHGEYLYALPGGGVVTEGMF